MPELRREGVCRFAFPPNLLSFAQHLRVPARAQGQWPCFKEGAGAAGDDVPRHRQGNQRRRCPRGPPSAVRGLLPVAARPPATPPASFTGRGPPASLTPSASRAAHRWGRASKPQEERALRFSPGRLCPGREPRTLSSGGASPPLCSPDAHLSPGAPNFTVTLSLPSERRGRNTAGRKSRKPVGALLLPHPSVRPWVWRAEAHTREFAGHLAHLPARPAPAHWSLAPAGSFCTPFPLFKASAVPTVHFKPRPYPPSPA